MLLLARRANQINDSKHCNIQMKRSYKETDECKLVFVFRAPSKSLAYKNDNVQPNDYDSHHVENRLLEPQRLPQKQENGQPLGMMGLNC